VIPWQINRLNARLDLALSQDEASAEIKGADQAPFGFKRTARGELEPRSSMRRGAKSKPLEHPPPRLQGVSDPDCRKTPSSPIAIEWECDVRAAAGRTRVEKHL
jgi:hypothetical protein